TGLESTEARPGAAATPASSARKAMPCKAGRSLDRPGNPRGWGDIGSRPSSGADFLRVGHYRTPTPTDLRQSPGAPRETTIVSGITDCGRAEEPDMAPEQQLIVSVSGIRGIVGDGLTPELAASFA